MGMVFHPFCLRTFITHRESTIASHGGACSIACQLRHLPYKQRLVSYLFVVSIDGLLTVVTSPTLPFCRGRGRLNRRLEAFSVLW